MRPSQLVKRSLIYYWRSNLAVVLGVAVAIAVLSGALLVGDSVRTSLKDLVVQRLGKTTHVFSSSTFFRTEIAKQVQTRLSETPEGFRLVCPIISIQGTATHERSKRVASAINVYGVDQRFWEFNQREVAAPADRAIYLSPSLANELGTTSGDTVLLQLEKPSAIPLESLNSKKEDLGKTLRLTATRVLNGEESSEFSIQPEQAGVRAIFVAMDLLQRELEQPGKANSLLIATDHLNEAELTRLVQQFVTLADLGINLRDTDKLRVVPAVHSASNDGIARPEPGTSSSPTVVSLEHESKVISDQLENTVSSAAESLQIRHAPVLSYLANSIRRDGQSIPYSLVTALDDQDFKQLLPVVIDRKSNLPPIILNEWAASDLAVKPGDELTLEYYLWQEGGRLETKTSSFELVGIVPIAGLAAQQNLVPEYPGITGAENLSDWDPPFPIDLQRIRSKDEDYWHKYHTTPKAFLPLATGQSLWQTRFGKVSSIRLWLTPDSLITFKQKLRDQLNPGSLGMTVQPVRAQGLESSKGATDFGEYFLYFSFFLVVSALLLTTLFFKLGVEQRVREIGLLRAIGFGPSLLRQLFLTEALILAVIGGVLGLLGAIGYGQFMMFGLRTWWVGAVGTTALKLHVSTQPLIIGAVGGVLAALVCVLLSLRSLRKQSTRRLLAGNIGQENLQETSGTMRFRIGIVLAVLGVLLLIAATLHLLSQTVGFFVGGTFLLISLLFFQSSWLRRRPETSLSGSGLIPLVQLGFRNATHRPARSVLCIALIAAATFIVVSVDSFRHRGEGEMLEQKSGSGGFPLLAESTVPLINDPATREGQQSLNLADDNPQSPIAGVKLTRFRVQPGDDTSCLNLYQPRNPKIIAPTNDFLESNRFSFASSLAESNEEKNNPWLLLNRELPNSVVPVIGDANSLTYVLHLKPGDEITVQHGDKSVRLRIVGSLSDSVLQSELVMSEKNFVRLFPDQQGYRFFLIDLPSVSRASKVTAALEDRLADYGFDVQSTSERLASFHLVENTYLSTFQMLGGLGLILGTIGLGAVLLRNVLERRRELALMRAIGYNSKHFTLMVVAENSLLLFGGLVTGGFCAALAIAPVFLIRRSQPINISLGLMLVAVLVAGLTASIVATWATIKTPLLASLKAE